MATRMELTTMVKIDHPAEWIRHYAAQALIKSRVYGVVQNLNQGKKTL